MRLFFSIRHRVLILLSLSVVGLSFSQTVNTGMLYVDSETVFSTVEEFNNTDSGTFFNDGDSYIYNHFNNDGTVDFIEGGLTRFVGSVVQQITGQNQSYFYDVLFNNLHTSVPFELIGSISVNNISYFQNGIVDNEDFGGSIVFENSASHQFTSDYSHVDGYVLKRGDTEFLYPIGDGGYFRYASISAPELEADVFEGKYFLQNSDAVYPHEKKEVEINIINNTEYWLVDRIEGVSEALLTLSWHEETTPYEIIDTPWNNDIRIVRWDNIQQKWINQGGLVNEVDKTVTAVVTGYGIFTLAKVNLEFEEEDCVIFNAITPGDDGMNDLFKIECAELFPNNTVTIFNRWGVKVFERDGYNNDDVAFKGVSEGRVTLKPYEELPTGTYFYIIRFNGETNPGKNEYTGFLYINK